ncbi:MAG: hypothetical protein KI792_09340 [Alphaproteobacteria bacterium]|nr:hypothetical protein [Alphaproteobacteria bacterium SS10]
MEDKTKFVLISVARTGSNYIVGMLNKHPDCHCHFEIANPSQVVGAEGGPVTTNRPLTREFRDEDPVGFTNAAFDTKKPFAAVGFKIFGGDVPEIVQFALKSKDIKKIVLRRDNLLASYSSMTIAMANGVWRAKEKSDLRETKVEFIPEKFDHYRNVTSQFYQRVEHQLSSEGQEFLKLSYSKLRDPEQAQALFRFLNLAEPASPEADLLRQNSKDMLERFSNPAVVQTHMRDIGQEDWMSE